MLELVSFAFAAMIALCVLAVIIAQAKLRDRSDYIRNAPPLGLGPDGKLNLLKPGERPPLPRIIPNAKEGLIITMAALTAAMLMTSTALAGDNSCYGVVSSTGKIGTPADGRVCTFVVNSNVGRKILRECPVRSTCEVVMPLASEGGSKTDEIKGRFYARREK